MPREMLSELSAREVALEYIEVTWPGSVCSRVAAIELGGGWLVEAEMDGSYGDEGSEKLLLMVTRSGSVDEIGHNGVTRQNVHRSLADLRSPLAV